MYWWPRYFQLCSLQVSRHDVPSTWVGNVVQRSSEKDFLHEFLLRKDFCSRVFTSECGVQHHAPIELPLCRNRQWHEEAQQDNPLAHWMARFHHDSQSSVHCNRKAGASMPKTSALRKSFSFQASGKPFKLDSDSQCKRHEPRVCNCRTRHQDNLSLWNLTLNAKWSFPIFSISHCARRSSQVPFRCQALKWKSASTYCKGTLGMQNVRKYIRKPQ